MKKELKIVLRRLLSDQVQVQWNIPRNPSRYAYEYEALSGKLRWGRQKSAADFLERNDEQFYRKLKLFKDTSAAATFNPHKPQLDSPYFVSTETIEDLDILLPYDDDGAIRYQNIVHVGPKGSGKTTVQNQWLHRNHERLESKRVFYVRCDAPKLFEFWERHFESPERWPLNALPTIEEYLDFQTLYILAKNSNAGLPAEILRKLESSGVEFEYKEDRAPDSPLRSKKRAFWYLSEHIAKNVSLYERGDPGRSYLVGSLFEDKPTKRREYFRWKECADSVRKWMRENGYIALRILDGVDNLHLNTEAGKAIYAKFLPEIRKFILRTCPPGEIHFAVMRNRTWVDVQNKDPVTQGSPLIASPKEIEHIPPNSADVLIARIKWMRTHLNSEDCARVIESTVRTIPSGSRLHHNMRTVIVGAASLAEQVRFRCHQLGGGHIDVDHHANVQMKRNLFLNGRFFLETQRSYASMNREKGLPYLNPFWFPDDFVLQPQARDPLFLRIRLLELLEHSDMLEVELKFILSETFKYDPSAIELAVDDSRAFGWIDTKSEQSGISHRTFEINEMGRYLLNDLLSDIDCLYMLALDTRLPKALFDNGLIQVHTNHLRERSGYVGAAAVTLISFVNWLHSTNIRELKDVDSSNLKVHYRSVFLSVNAMKTIATQFARKMRSAGQEDWELLASKCDLMSGSEKSSFLLSPRGA